MSFKHSNAAREVPGEKFDSATQRYIFIEVCHLSDARGVVYQSQAEIANGLLLSRVTVSTEFGKLTEKGLLRKSTGHYEIGLLITKENAVEPVITRPPKAAAEDEADDPLAGMSELDIWWEENCLLDENKTEVMPIEADEVPDFVIEARKAGLLKLRPEKVIHRGLWCVVYERV